MISQPPDAASLPLTLLAESQDDAPLNFVDRSASSRDPPRANSFLPPPGLSPPDADVTLDNQAEAEVVETVAQEKKKYFPPHLNEDDWEKGLQDGRLFKGVLRVNMRRPSIAYICQHGQAPMKSDWMVCGLDKNRAIHGDVVIFEEITEDEPAAASSSSHAQVVEDSDSDEEQISFSRAVVVTDDYDEPMEDDKTDDKKIRRKARVLAIAEFKGRNRMIVCTLHQFDPLRSKRDKDGPERKISEHDKFVKAMPTDARMPPILLQMNERLKVKLRSHGPVKKTDLWQIQILAWKETSSLPLGHIVGDKSLGAAGDLSVEVKHCLIENCLINHDRDFDDALLDEVDDVVCKAGLDFDREVKRRHDLRTKRIFTIDPATARDLDDAIHVDFDAHRREVEIGVHIADVAHFVELGSHVDAEAQQRTTSVYLIDRVLPMLPHGLCNHLCSLNPDEPKLSFSAFFRLSAETGELVEDPMPWFEKTVMRSCCRLNYDEVQQMLDGHEIEEPRVYGGHTWEQIKNDIDLLYDVCGKVRRRRFGGGALAITKKKMIFHTRESHNGIPTSFHVEEHSASHWIIEELMLLANQCVARHLRHSALSHVAVLRRHEGPDAEKAESLNTLMTRNLRLEWDATDAGALHKSCQEIYRKYGETTGLCVQMLAMRHGMRAAEYFVVTDDSNPHHYALNFDHYTHFTSPIRRYPDIMVHRVLNALISGAEDGFQSAEEATGQVEVCNEKRVQTRKCSEQLDVAVFCVYLRSQSELFYTSGTVLKIMEDKRRQDNDGVSVYCAHVGREKTIKLMNREAMARCKLYNSSFSDELMLPDTWQIRGKGSVELTWSKDGERKHQTVRMLSSVPVVIVPLDTVPIDFAMFFVSPLHPKFGDVSKDILPAAAEGFEWDFDEDDRCLTIVHDADMHGQYTPDDD